MAEKQMIRLAKPYISEEATQKVTEVLRSGNLVQGENVKMSGFGSLNVIQRKGRLGRNPQTGDRIELMSSKYVTFRPSRLLEF